MFIYITRLASNEIFSPSNKIYREVGRAKDLSTLLNNNNWLDSGGGNDVTFYPEGDIFDSELHYFPVSL